MKKSDEKEKLFKRRNWFIYHLQVILLLLLEEHVSSGNMHCDIVVDDNEVWVYHKILSTNRRTNWSYSRGSFTQK